MDKPAPEPVEPYRSLLAGDMAEKIRKYVERASPADLPASIYRVPPNIRGGDPGAYDPQIISIGPYHHGRDSLQAMEDHKWRYMHDLFRRNPEVDFIESALEAVGDSEERARRYYSESIQLSSVEFVKMMVLDGCFMLELFLKFYNKKERDDPIFAVAWILPLIRSDLLKLENQIPFFILDKLFDIAVGRSSSNPRLRDLVFIYLMMRKGSETRWFEDEDVYHLLHFYDLVLLPRMVVKQRYPRSKGKADQYGTVPSAAELSAAGVKLRRKPAAETILDVTFRRGTLEMPPLVLGDNTNSMFRNLIALEQCSPISGNHFTSYVLFLDGIIDTPRDVAMLQRCGIVDNKLGSDEEVALLVNQLCKRVTINYRGHYLAALFQEVNEYCGSRWRKYRARLIGDLFSNPWAPISVQAAVVLLALTCIQTLFIVLLYYKRQTVP